MENNELMNVTEGVEVAPVVNTKKIGAGEVTILTFASVGVLATGYGLFKLGKWVFGKIKDAKTNKAAQELGEAVAEAKAEESTAE